MNEKKLLPQANNLDTVVRVFIYCSVMDEFSLTDIAEFCHFEPRQASYYLNACTYLGLVNKKGEISLKGKYILENYPAPQLGVYECVISDSLISKIFSHMLFSPDDDVITYAIKEISPLYPEYGDAVLKRRASTLKSWCEHVIHYLKCSLKKM